MVARRLALEEGDGARHGERYADEAESRQLRVHQVLVERRHVALPHEAHPDGRLVQKGERVAVARRQHRTFHRRPCDLDAVVAVGASRAPKPPVRA